jgi:hypothetical protein
MSKGKKSQKPKKPQSTLKVSPRARDMVVDVAEARGESVEELFETKEGRTFFAHLLSDAGKLRVQAAERLLADE